MWYHTECNSILIMGVVDGGLSAGCMRNKLVEKGIYHLLCISSGDKYLFPPIYYLNVAFGD